MGMNATPSADRVHIGIFGRSNVGKSSLINALTGQQHALVSPIAGTTTDPVRKTMEILPLGPVVLIDTPGLDDQTELGPARISRAMEQLDKVDLALVVVEAAAGKTTLELDLQRELTDRGIVYITVYNKADALANLPANTVSEKWVSAATGGGIAALRQAIGQLKPAAEPTVPIVADLLRPGDLVVLVTPIDAAAPKGRMILPQQQTIRDILDADAQTIVTKETGLVHALASLSAMPRMVITDSQAFDGVAKDVPERIPLTSFSILFARHKGILRPAVEGLLAVPLLKDGSKVLMAEGCTHHRQCGDIGTEKLPRWLAKFTGKQLAFSFCSGNSFPHDLSCYDLVVHCGGCMLQERVVRNRMKCATEQGVPMTNYGTLIAHMNGILVRSLEPFQDYGTLASKIASQAER